MKKVVNYVIGWVIVASLPFLLLSNEDRAKVRNVVVYPFTIQEVYGQVPITILTPYHNVIGTSPVQLGSSGTNVLGVSLQAICPGQTMYLGISGSVSTTSGWPMPDGSILTLEVDNANRLYMVATGTTCRVAILPYRR